MVSLEVCVQHNECTILKAENTELLMNKVTCSDGNNDNPEFLYYMNEGVYGPFNQKLLGNTIAAPSVHKVSRSPL